MAATLYASVRERREELHAEIVRLCEEESNGLMNGSLPYARFKFIGERVESLSDELARLNALVNV